MTDNDFHAYVEGASPRLLRVAFLLTGDRHAAEDLLQDAFTKLFLRWNRVREPDAYVRRSLANSAANRWRSRARRPETRLLEAHDRAADAPGAQDRDLLVTALAQLPAGQRAVVVLRYLEELSVDEVASTLRISPGTVKSQTARALPRLRSLLTIDEESLS